MSARARLWKRKKDGALFEVRPLILPSHRLLFPSKEEAEYQAGLRRVRRKGRKQWETYHISHLEQEFVRKNRRASQ